MSSSLINSENLSLFLDPHTDTSPMGPMFIGTEILDTWITPRLRSIPGSISPGPTEYFRTYRGSSLLGHDFHGGNESRTRPDLHFRRLDWRLRPSGGLRIYGEGRERFTRGRGTSKSVVYVWTSTLFSNDTWRLGVGYVHCLLTTVGSISEWSKNTKTPVFSWTYSTWISILIWSSVIR